MPESVDPNLQPVGKRGGPDFHKPGCKCNACVARRRKAEAIALRTGSDTPAPVVQSSEVLTDTPIMGKDVQRHRIKMWLQWKALEPKLTQADAAERLGIATQTLTNLIHRATKDGWLQFENPLDELEYEILPDVNRVIKKALKNDDAGVAVKVAQGTIFKQYLDNKGVKDAPTTVLALKIEMPAGFTPDPTQNPIKGVIVGSPRTFDAEIVKAEDSNE